MRAFILLFMLHLCVLSQALAQPSEPTPAAQDAAPADPQPRRPPQEPHGPSANAQRRKKVDPIIQVTVVGTSIARSAGSAHIMRPDQLDRFEFDDPHAALLQVPGVYVRQEDGFGLRPNVSLRGANSDRSKKVTLMEDGVLFGPAPYSAPAAYYYPLLTRMRQLRVIKGPSSVAYGPQTIGGAIDLVTRRIPSLTKASIDMAVGQFGYRKAHAHFGASDEQTGFLIEGVHLGSDGFKELPSGADTGFVRNEWMAKGRYVLNPSAKVTHEFQVKLGYYDEVSNETYLGLTDADFDSNPDRRYPASARDQMRGSRTQLVLSHVAEAPALHLTLTTTAYRHDYDRVWRKLNSIRGSGLAAVLAEPTLPENARYYEVLSGATNTSDATDTLLIGPNDRSFISEGIQTVLDWAVQTGPVGQRVEAGLRLHYDTVRRRHSQSGYQMRNGHLVLEQGVATATTTSNRDSAIAFAAHVLDAITIGSLTLTPGVRLEVIHSSAEDFLTGESNSADTVVGLPGIGAFYGLTRDLGVLAGVYRGFSPPVLSAEESAASDDPQPEYSINYEAGARYTRRRSRLEVIGFFNDYSNLTNICTFSNGCIGANLDRQFDGGAVHIYGLEAYGEHTLRLGPVKVPVTAAYTFTRTAFQTSFSSTDTYFGDVEKDDELPYVPRHQFNATVAAEHRLGRLTASATYTSRSREAAGSGSLDNVLTTGALFTVDFGAALTAIWDFELYINLRNAFDQRVIVSRRPFGARPNAPRMVHVGLKGEI